MRQIPRSGGREVFSTEITITEDFDGKSLLDYLSHGLSLSHRSISRLKRTENGMVLSGNRVTVRAILHRGDRLSLALEDEQSSDNIVPTDLELDILYEDERIVAVNKPPQMPTHPSHGHYTDTLANALAYYYEKQGRSFVFRAINRLDRDTSGVVLIAKDKDAAAKLTAQLGTESIRKVYLALLCGTPTPGEGRIENYIRRASESIITREVVDSPLPGAAAAVTDYRLLDSGGDCSLVLASPKTGRTHQLRVHFASIGHPIVGDSLYGSADPRIGRQALHALSLTFVHPTTAARMTVVAPPPEDFVGMTKSVGIQIPDPAIRKDHMFAPICDNTDSFFHDHRKE